MSKWIEFGFAGARRALIRTSILRSDTHQGQSEWLKSVAVTRQKPVPLYVHRPVIDDGGLLFWAASKGIGDLLSPRDLHVTITYSKAPVDVGDVKGVAREDLLVATAWPPVRIRSSLALPLQSHELMAEHERYIDAGASYDYADTYVPHLSLKYDPGPEDLAALSAGDPFAGKLRLGPQERAPLTPGWEPDPDQPLAERKAEGGQ